MAGTNDQFDWDDAIGGGLLSGYTAIIRNPEFGIDEDYRDNVVRLMVDLEVTDNPDPDSDIEVGHVFHEAFNVGRTDSFEAAPDGSSVSKIGSGKVKVNGQSGMGLLIAGITGHPMGDADETTIDNYEGFREALQERGLTAWDAAVYDGIECVWERLAFSFTNDDNEKVNYERVYPTKFIGVEDDSAPASTSSNGEVSWDQVEGEIKELAKESDGYSTWLAAVVGAYPGISDSPLNAQVMDSSNSGLYAKANA